MYPTRITCLALGCLVSSVAAVGNAATYNVGPGQPLATPSDVAWESLAAGDVVRIHWRAAPYANKWVVNVAGTAVAPVIVQGVPGPNGELPVIDGNGATTRQALSYWSETRGVIKIGGSSTPNNSQASHIVIENLEIRGARPPYGFTDDSGAALSYPNNAAAIFVESGNHITIRNCVLHDCGNGLFVAAASSDVLVEGNHLLDNGNVGSIYEHNSYTAAAGITFQHNRYGPLRAGAGGNNLKDRSAGTVIRYNWIESGNRQLDLVDAEDSVALQQDPRYRSTFVYGNVLIEPDGAGNRQIIHYGGDSGNTPAYRKGMLYLHHNTIVSTRAGRTTLLRLSTNDETADCRNNIIFVTDSG
ncbi:MAG TPA: polysaccharide-degrading enzyme, partial [Verrucomicrobiales bacterium]|nr:polysaccharide-degrading enzyme [Verrucomicrobiales bacterium]